MHTQLNRLNSMPILREKKQYRATREREKRDFFEEIKSVKKEAVKIPHLDLFSLNKKLDESILRAGKYQIVVLDDKLEDRTVSKKTPKKI